MFRFHGFTLGQRVVSLLVQLVSQLFGQLLSQYLFDWLSRFVRFMRRPRAAHP